MQYSGLEFKTVTTFLKVDACYTLLEWGSFELIFTLSPQVNTISIKVVSLET